MAKGGPLIPVLWPGRKKALPIQGRSSRIWAWSLQRLTALRSSTSAPSSPSGQPISARRPSPLSWHASRRIRSWCGSGPQWAWMAHSTRYTLSECCLQPPSPPNVPPLEQSSHGLSKLSCFSGTKHLLLVLRIQGKGRIQRCIHLAGWVALGDYS